MIMPEKILIDTDPGIDDTMAILLALRSPELQVVGLTSVFGNTDSNITAQNALRIVELEGHAQIPVAQGSGIPLVIAPRSHGKRVHHEDGMGGANLPPPQGKLVPKSAAQFIVDTVLANPGEITLVPIGPLTNVALALRIEPRIAELVKRVVIMGGAATVPGNASPVAEANIHNDPDAAHIVFGAGWDLTMVGLDVTHKTVMTSAYIEDLIRVRNPATDLIRQIVPHYLNFFREFRGFGDGIATHDPSATALLIDPSLFKVERMPIFVETQGHCAGQTVPDRRRQWREVPEINVCLDVDSSRLLEMYRERITRA
jgi:uridine nucleosidase